MGSKLTARDLDVMRAIESARNSDEIVMTPQMLEVIRRTQENIRGCFTNNKRYRLLRARATGAA